MIGSSAQEVANQNEHPDSSEMRNIDLESKVKLLEGELKDMEEECDCQRNTIAVNDMLYKSFKERMREQNMYDSDDTEVNRMMSKDKGAFNWIVWKEPEKPKYPCAYIFLIVDPNIIRIWIDVRI